MSGFLQGLKQRKLVQWAVAYVAFAFALLQGVDVIAHQFDWPEAVGRGVTLALVVGFFIVLVVAWYHGERGVQTIGGVEVLIIAVLLAIGGIVLWRFDRVQAARGSDVSPRRIARRIRGCRDPFQIRCRAAVREHER